MTTALVQTEREALESAVREYVENLDRARGFGIRSLAARWGLNPETLRVELYRQGVRVPGRGRRRFTESSSQGLLELYQEGWLVRELAERYNCSAPTIRAELKRRGVRLRTKGETWAKLIEAARARHESV